MFFEKWPKNRKKTRVFYYRTKKKVVDRTKMYAKSFRDSVKGSLKTKGL